MATIPTQTHALNSDFTSLAHACEQAAAALLESDNAPQREALCNGLIARLTLLRGTLNDPIPEHLVASLTTDHLPPIRPHFEPESEQLADYCTALTQVLSNGDVALDIERALTGLLFDLVTYLAEDLRSPRFIRTASGIKAIEDVRA